MRTVNYFILGAIIAAVIAVLIGWFRAYRKKNSSGGIQINPSFDRQKEVEAKEAFKKRYEGRMKEGHGPVLIREKEDNKEDKKD